MANDRDANEANLISADCLAGAQLKRESIRSWLSPPNRLTQDEVSTVASQALGVVSGEQTHSIFNPMSTEYPSVDVPEDTSTVFSVSIRRFLV